MAKIKVNKKDADRIILTELLPYEVPLRFSNEGLYDFLERISEGGETAPQLVYTIFGINPTTKEYSSFYTVPYNYKIKKDNLGTRVLSVMHPATQFRFIGLYSNYSSLITNLCKRSPFSLRSPIKIASHFYEKGLAEKNMDIKRLM